MLRHMAIDISCLVFCSLEISKCMTPLSRLFQLCHGTEMSSLNKKRYFTKCWAVSLQQTKCGWKNITTKNAWWAIKWSVEENSFYHWFHNIFSKALQSELSCFNMMDYICHLKVVQFAWSASTVDHKIRFGSKEAHAKKAKQHGCKSTAMENSVSTILLNHYRKEKRFDRWVEKRRKKKLPLVQQKHMTSQFCHCNMLTPLFSMEMGID